MSINYLYGVLLSKSIINQYVLDVLYLESTTLPKLQQDDSGYFLFIEAGRIDHGLVFFCSFRLSFQTESFSNREAVAHVG